MAMTNLTLVGTTIDDIDDTDKYEITVDVLGIEPFWTKIGEDKEKTDGHTRVSRWKWAFFKVIFFPLTVNPADPSLINSFADYSKIQKVLSYKYVWFKATTLTRPTIDSTIDEPVNLWDPERDNTILPLKVEATEESKSAKFENGNEDYEIVFKSAVQLDISQF